MPLKSWSVLFSLAALASSVSDPFPSRADSLPAHALEHVSDVYLEGYIQALVDAHYYEYRVVVKVKDHRVYLMHLPKNGLVAESIIGFVRDIPGVKGVEVAQEGQEVKHEKIPKVEGIWFPQSTVLFQPLVADPREAVYSAAFRYGDRVIGKEVAAVSLGDDFPIFRWRDVFRWHGDLEIGIAAAIWAVFNYSHIPNNIHHEICELVNTDYYVSIPLTYAVDRWSFRLRLYHISSHLGDEFLVHHPKFIAKRKNVSFEVTDFFTAYQFTKQLRAYLGPGIILHSDRSFPMKTFYVQYGAELRILGQKLYYHSLFGTPFFALHLENWQVRHWDMDVTYKMGYEISKLHGIGRKMRLYVDYHHGFSYEGQFFKRRTQYGEVGFSWGF